MQWKRTARATECTASTTDFLPHLDVRIIFFAVFQLKNAKITAEARERSAAARDYSAGIAERRQKEEKVCP